MPETLVLAYARKSLIPAYAINDTNDHSVDSVFGEIEFSTT